MSSPITTKRRKLNETSKALSKPFVSPLKRPDAGQTPLKDNRNAANLVYQPSTLAHTVTSLTHDGSKPTASTIGLVTTPARSTPVRRQHAYPTSSSKRTDPAEVAAQRALTSLELQIRSVRNELDTLKQAVQISSSTTDADLDELALKWKIAAQSAAEELFGTVKERVCRMGGAAAWRESEKKKHDRSNGLGEFAQEAEESDYADCEFDSEGEELPDDEQEYRKKEKKRAKQEMRDAAEVEVPVEEEGTRKTQVWQEGGDDDDAFTIDMMLRSLNIELRVIGYNKIQQRWVT